MGNRLLSLSKHCQSNANNHGWKIRWDITKPEYGETYPIKKDIFAKTYDLLTDSCSSFDSTSTPSSANQNKNE